MQRDFIANLRLELQQRQSNDEHDLVIKYIKGVPIIICSKN